MSDSRPWEVGDHEARWIGYLIAPDSQVLRNKVGATTVADLRTAENDLIEVRVAELRSHTGLVERTYDRAHLQPPGACGQLWGQRPHDLPRVRPPLLREHLDVNQSSDLPGQHGKRDVGLCSDEATSVHDQHRDALNERAASLHGRPGRRVALATPQSRSSHTT